ncbi:hypothetical protein AB0M46_36505 [Dactylosporangium sp. NPDC051485]|uniref:alpha/beta fold hydrolase n=1 Tax=Dactylosporangium sp. NPDC051485 TaxID=3154846 RepID=UPI00342A67B2
MAVHPGSVDLVRAWADRQQRYDWPVGGFGGGCGLGACVRGHRQLAGGHAYGAAHARRVEVPSGFSLFPADLVRPPRPWLDRIANTVRVSEHARGGHFAPFEQPQVYAEELREFFRPYRA